jgi:signal transduction histidine kinase
MKSLVDAINEKSQDLEVQLSGVIQEADGHIQSALAGLSIPTLDLLDQAIAMADDRRLLGVLETRLQEMNSQMEMYRGLVSTGLAAEVVNHEFNQQYELIHKIFEKPQVKALLSQYPDIQRVDELFRHIEERHRLLSPLYRRNRLYRKTLSIYEIAERMRQLFANHLDLYDIKFRNEIDKDFVVYESEPILYPVFINLLNNALYWLLNKSQRVILLHSDTTQGSLFIEDSGPGIEPERTERIFELFYSTRVDGRGIGLHLVRELLSSRNHLIDCVTSGPQKFLGGACFRIQFDPDAVRPGGEAK